LKISGTYVTVLYGHVDFKGIPQKGDTVTAGQTIGLLAPARSYASDGNRKHLHLGIHKGKEIDFRGYVANKAGLDSYIDPADILSTLSIDFPGESPGETPYWQENTEQ